jgi:hypothetical protein
VLPQCRQPGQHGATPVLTHRSAPIKGVTDGAYRKH